VEQGAGGTVEIRYQRSGIRDQGIGNRDQGIGNRELVVDLLARYVFLPGIMLLSLSIKLGLAAGVAGEGLV
jgi:hypothetical protein